MKITKAFAVRAGVALATVAIGAGITAQAAQAATPSSGHSINVKVPAAGSVVLSEMCPMGSHVDGYWGTDEFSGGPTGIFTPLVKVSNGWVYRDGQPTATHPYTNGKDGLYQGFSIKVDNYYVFKSETSTISWTCAAN